MVARASADIVLTVGQTNRAGATCLPSSFRAGRGRLPDSLSNQFGISSTAETFANGQTHFRHRRGGQLPRERAHVSIGRDVVGATWPASPDAEVRPLYQRRSRHDVAVSTRRSLVLDDGAETDLDLGHYERFTHAPLNKDCNYTTGKIYLSIIEKERRGEYKGKTVQVIPHVTDEIKSCIRKMVAPGVDVVITEIGGTVGDIEGMPFFEAIRQFALDVGRNNCLFIHLTLVPYLKAAGELKTKPTQHSVMELRKIGIQPDVLICRTEREIPESDCEKIAQMCSVERRAVIEEKDKELSIYEVPLGFAEKHLDELVADKLGMVLPQCSRSMIGVRCSSGFEPGS